MSRPAGPAPSASTSVSAARRGPGLLPVTWLARRDTLLARWAALGARERLWLSAAAGLIGALLLWTIAIQPAWRTVREAPARIELQGAQLQTMQRLAAETAELRTIAPVATAQADAALQGATDRLGEGASLLLQGDRATVTVNGLSGDALRDWLIEVRSAARARPTEVQLSRQAEGYSGTVVLSLGGSR